MSTRLPAALLALVLLAPLAVADILPPDVRYVQNEIVLELPEAIAAAHPELTFYLYDPTPMWVDAPVDRRIRRIVPGEPVSLAKRDDQWILVAFPGEVPGDVEALERLVEGTALRGPALGPFEFYLPEKSPVARLRWRLRVEKIVGRDLVTGDVGPIRYDDEGKELAAALPLLPGPGADRSAALALYGLAGLGLLGLCLVGRRRRS